MNGIELTHKSLTELAQTTYDSLLPLEDRGDFYRQLARVTMGAVTGIHEVGAAAPPIRCVVQSAYGALLYAMAEAHRDAALNTPDGAAFTSWRSAWLRYFHTAVQDSLRYLKPPTFVKSPTGVQ